MEDSEGVLARFNRLMRDLDRGLATRNCFRDWEVDLLLDFARCRIPDGNRKRTLQRYRKAVERSLEKGALTPLKLSEYLSRSRARHPEVVGQPISGAA